MNFFECDRYMQVPKPQDFFDHPENYYSFVISHNFEGQFYDRKEFKTGNPKPKDIAKLVVECASAFSNSNSDGGIIVVGVTDSGEINGIDHLSESQINAFFQVINQKLRNNNIDHKEVIFFSSDGLEKKVIVCYAKYATSYLCETTDTPPKAWERKGKQNLIISAERRRELESSKGVINFENQHCYEYNLKDIDQDIVKELKNACVNKFGLDYDVPLESFLYKIGATIEKSGEKFFTNAGYLFFAQNPTIKVSGSYVRILKYRAKKGEVSDPANTVADQDFYGPIPKIIRGVRKYLNEGAFFDTYRERLPDGGFKEEKEFPPIAIDEAIVNAVVHKDYGVNSPIFCYHYTDYFIVENPGRIPQSVPESFSLDEFPLAHKPRNGNIVNWLSFMEDKRGKPFVLRLGEGTNRMRKEMQKFGLPSPTYSVNERGTFLLLENNYDSRIKPLSDSSHSSTEFTNLFRIECSTKLLKENNILKKLLLALKSALIAKGWYIDKDSFGQIVAHRRGNEKFTDNEVSKILKIFPGYVFQFKVYTQKLYLLIDYKVEIKNIMRLNQLLKLGMDLTNYRGISRVKNSWEDIKIINVGEHSSTVFCYNLQAELDLSNDEIIPQLKFVDLKKVIHNLGISYNLSEKTKEFSLSHKQGLSKQRADYCKNTAEYLSNHVFPLSISGETLSLDENPQLLKHPTGTLSHHSTNEFTVYYTLNEPEVEFSKSRSSEEILEGLTKYGSYSKPSKEIQLYLVCPSGLQKKMTELVTLLNQGSYKFKGAERTFGIKFICASIITYEDTNEIIELTLSHIKETTNSDLFKAFVICLPEEEDSPKAPYYIIKKFLLEKGFPVQVVNTPTVQNPKFKDLNLALNICAKCGVTPWVLPDQLPNVDYFVGLSYTQFKIDSNLNRLMGFANVFNKYGKWQFYNGTSQTFTFEEKTHFFAEIVRQTLKRIDRKESPTIYFHTSAKMSRKDYQNILDTAKKEIPKGNFKVVWINTDHHLRLYNNAINSDGSLSRGAFVITRDNQVLLSTTGDNVFQKSIGTPKMLELNLMQDSNQYSFDDLSTMAKHILHLTKLNWASTKSICGEPITVKYAGEIARLTHYFLQGSAESNSFSLPDHISNTPWFI